MTNQETQLDVQKVIDSMANKIAALTTDLAVKEAMISQLQEMLANNASQEMPAPKEPPAKKQASGISASDKAEQSMTKGFQFKETAEVPAYDFAASLAQGIRLFDPDALVHIKESTESMMWDISVMFNLNGGNAEYVMIHKLFSNAVASCGGEVVNQKQTLYTQTIRTPTFRRRKTWQISPKIMLARV